MFYCCVLCKHVVFFGIKMPVVLQKFIETRTVQMALVGPRSNVVSPHGIVVDRSSRPLVTGPTLRLLIMGKF